MEPVSETDEEQVPEDLGKLTVVDKARTGRVSLKKETNEKKQKKQLDLKYHEIMQSGFRSKK